MLVRQIHNFFKEITIIEIICLSLLLILTIFLRFWNLEKWTLVQSDELYMIHQLNQPILSEKGLESTYFPVIILTKLFFFIDSFPGYRYIIAFLSIIGIFFVYLATKNTLRKKKSIFAFLAMILVSINAKILSFSLQFQNVISDILFPPIILYLYFKWVNTKNKIYIPLIFFFSALGINGHASMIYFVFPLFIWFFYLILKKQIELKLVFLSGIIFMFFMIPYFEVLIKNTLAGDLNMFLRWRYFSYGLSYQKPYLVNLFHPDSFLKFLSFSLFTNEYWFTTSFILFLLTFLLILYLKNNTHEKKLTFLIWQSYGIILLMFFSIVPAYNPAQFIPFIIVLSSLIAKIASSNYKFVKLVLLLSLILLYFNILSVIDILKMNEYDKLEKIWPSHVEKIIIERYSYNILGYTHLLKNITKFDIFGCEDNGIYSVNFEDAKEIFPKNISYNPDYFRDLNLTNSDLIIFHKRCLTQGYLSRINLTLENLHGLSEIPMFRVV
jgi:hypothetical protein